MREAAFFAVRYARPDGHQDDCAVALALAAQRSRTCVSYGAWTVSHEPQPSFDA